MNLRICIIYFFFFQAEDGIRDKLVTGVQTCALPIYEEGKNTVAPFVRKERFKIDGTAQSMNYPIVLGNDATADKFGGLLGFPTSVLISKDGHVVKRVDGLVSYGEIDKAIQSQLAANEGAAH